MIAFIITAFYLAGALAAVEAIMTARTAQGAVAWSVSLVSLPFVAVPAYLVFGRSKFEGMTDAYAQSKDKIQELATEFRENIEPWQVLDERRHPDYDAIRKLQGPS